MAPQSKDPTFKLFGRKIPVPETRTPAKDKCSEITAAETEIPKETNSGEPDKHLGQCQEKKKAPEQVNKLVYLKNSGTDQEKVFKKPDKILQCPRCNSLDTKFCYFNNYNVNQPRHFCKNCQRYWTAGGTVRNVPIGAGRRKNKHLASQYRQIMTSSDGKPITRMENSDSASHQLPSSIESVAELKPFTGNGIVLKFGSEASLCESMETVLNIGDRNGYINVNLTDCRGNVDEPSTSGSTVTASRIWGHELPESVALNEQFGLSGRTHELSSSQSVRCYSAPPLVFSSSPGCNNLVHTAAARYSCTQSSIPNRNGHGPVRLSPEPMLTGPGLCTPSIPLQFVPASYCDCMPVWNCAYNGCLSPSTTNF